MNTTKQKVNTYNSLTIKINLSFIFKKLDQSFNTLEKIGVGTQFTTFKIVVVTFQGS